ncbi:MAG: cob(I)yrinic acid a,c-diamide adenosyltransferase [Candidatus Thermoplasmatota archaeon]|nr:cob(I)yrinic acid a,c-diamide adenosyltransferase [Candidatus Thermoplasmatota archaeon]
MSFEKGYVQLYTGNGKGKTTAAVGLGVRASGAGLKVAMIQFMKGRRYSEIDAIERLRGFEVFQHGRDEFVNKGDPERIDIDLARGGMERAREAIGSGEYDLVILDEINVAIDFGLVDLDDVLRMLDSRPAHVEIVLTGRYAPKELMEMADLVTEMREIRHFYNSGVEARKGIEY